MIISRVRRITIAPPDNPPHCSLHCLFASESQLKVCCAIIFDMIYTLRLSCVHVTRLSNRPSCEMRQKTVRGRLQHDAGMSRRCDSWRPAGGGAWICNGEMRIPDLFPDILSLRHITPAMCQQPQVVVSLVRDLYLERRSHMAISESLSKFLEKP